MRRGGPIVAACLLASAAAFAQAPAGTGLTLRQSIAAALLGNAGVSVSRALAEAADAAVLQQQGAFDPAMTLQATRSRSAQPLRAGEVAALAAAGVALDTQQRDLAQAQAGITQQLASGLQASVSATHIHTRDTALAATGVPPQGTGVLTFQLRVPLLRNRADATVAPLRAAQSEAQAGRAELEHTVSQAVLSTAIAYWDYLARSQRLTLATEAERRGQGLLEELRKLADADEVPRAETRLAEASLSERRATRIAAEQSLADARRTLGRLLGLDRAGVQALGAPADPFPAPVASGFDTALASALSARAQDARGDVQALRLRREAARVRLAAARDQERPQLDVVLGASRAAMAERSAAWNLGDSFSRGAPPGWSVGMVYQQPLGNQAALGITGQQAAALAVLDARVADLEKAVEAQVADAVLAVARAAQQLQETERAVATYATGVENERTKRRLGMATLIDVLNVEDRYQASLLALVQARAGYAAALAQLRFESASLVTRDGDTHAARVDALLQARTD